MIVEGAKRHLGGIKERVEFVKPGQEVVTGITAVEPGGALHDWRGSPEVK